MNPKEQTHEYKTLVKITTNSINSQLQHNLKEDDMAKYAKWLQHHQFFSNWDQFQYSIND